MKAFVLISMLFSIPVAAQNWKMEKATDPMTDKIYSVFALSGSGINGDVFGNIIVSCADGKIAYSVFRADGITFQEDEYANANYTWRNHYSWVKIRIGDKIEEKKFDDSTDRTSLSIGKKDLDKISKAGSVILEYWEPIDRHHYIKFEGMNYTPEMLSVCGLK